MAISPYLKTAGGLLPAGISTWLQAQASIFACPDMNLKINSYGSWMPRDFAFTRRLSVFELLSDAAILRFLIDDDLPDIWPECEDEEAEWQASFNPTVLRPTKFDAKEETK
jgi:hypothetical protein